MPKQYNEIYKKLVKNPNDILGIVAYSVYKRQKFEFISKSTDSEESKEHPTDEEIATFTDISNSQAQLDFYEEAAANLLDGYAALSESEKVKELEENYNEQLAQNKKDYERKLRNSKSTNFMYGVSQSIVASLLIIIILGFLTFMVWSTKQGITPMIEEIWQIQILDKVEYQKLLDIQETLKNSDQG